jgi:hypothetical protein
MRGVPRRWRGVTCATPGEHFWKMRRQMCGARAGLKLNCSERNIYFSGMHFFVAKIIVLFLNGFFSGAMPVEGSSYNNLTVEQEGRIFFG